MHGRAGICGRPDITYTFRLLTIHHQAQFSGCFLLLSWCVWVDTSAPLFIKAFITSPLLSQLLEEAGGALTPPHTHTHTPTCRGWLRLREGSFVGLHQWFEWLYQRQDLSQTMQVTHQHVFLLTEWFHLEKSKTRLNLVLWVENNATLTMCATLPEE